MNGSRERDAKLASINSLLLGKNLRSLAKLGDCTQGEIEITSLVEMFEHSRQFFTDVKFAVVFPNGKPGHYTIRFNANGAVSDGAVMVPVVNNQFALVKQWRPPIGRWTYEVPRGFGETIDRAQLNGTLGTMKLGDLPLNTLIRELSEEVMHDAVVQSVAHLGNIAENTGTNAVIPSYYLVRIAVDEDRLGRKLSGSEELKVVLWNADRVKNAIGVHVADNHSITALFLAFRHLNL